MHPLSLIVFLLLLWSPAYAQYPEFPSGEEGLREMCDFLIKSDYKDRKKFTSDMIPNLQDCEMAFSKEKAKLIYRFIKRINQRHVVALSPMNKLQSEVQVWKAQKSDFETYGGNAPHFPGGYKEMAKYLKEDLDYFLVSFVEPGHKNGASFDLVAHVNGHWRLFLSPWVPCMD